MSCLDPKCPQCTTDDENYCPKFIGTYNGKYKDGSKSYGGYGDYARVPSHFVVKIPDGLPSEEAAPMLCGGVTVYSPLTRNGAGPGKTVGIIGIGGLGHFGLLFAKALGADRVVAISRSSSKKEDAQKLGADHFIATNEDDKWAKNNSGTIDLIVCTVSSHDMPLESYLRLLKVHGKFIQVGAPEDKLPSFNGFSLIQKGLFIGGSAIGSPKEIQEMLQLAAKQKIKPWIEARPLKDVNKAVKDMEANKARYRYVLVNENHA
jgi:alcohol dehydrogenase (NADP+)